MTKDILVKVQGLQITQEAGEGSIEVIAPGEYYYRNDKHYFLYEEVMEGQSDVTKNIIKVCPDYMELTKKGVVNVHMVFEKDKQNVTYYYTPFGSLLVGIDAYMVEVKEQENEIAVDVEYSLDINNEHLANCRIHLVATPKGQEGFQLM